MILPRVAAHGAIRPHRTNDKILMQKKDSKSYWQVRRRARKQRDSHDAPFRALMRFLLRSVMPAGARSANISGGSTKGPSRTTAAHNRASSGGVFARRTGCTRNCARDRLRILTSVAIETVVFQCLGRVSPACAVPALGAVVGVLASNTECTFRPLGVCKLPIGTR